MEAQRWKIKRFGTQFSKEILDGMTDWCTAFVPRESIAVRPVPLDGRGGNMWSFSHTLPWRSRPDIVPANDAIPMGPRTARRTWT
jgi:hypothetical protein